MWQSIGHQQKLRLAPRTTWRGHHSSSPYIIIVIINVTINVSISVIIRVIIINDIMNDIISVIITTMLSHP